MTAPRIQSGSREAAGFRVHRVRSAPGSGDQGATHAGAQPRAAVVLFHGFGAPGSDLVPIGREVLEAVPSLASDVEFFFPEAPLSLGGFPPFESRAWWMLDPERLEAMMAGEPPRDLGSQCPPELAELRPRVFQLLDWVANECGLSNADLILGGFSQGAMLATDIALHASCAPAGLVVFSGTMACEEIWTARARARPGLRVVVSHGRRDPLLAFASSERLNRMLSDAGAQVRFVPFDGAHEIPAPALQAFLRLLEEVVRERVQ